MVLETVKGQICINQLVEEKKDSFVVDNDIIVNDIKPDVLSVISTNGNICIQKKEINSGKVIIEGYINTYIVYLADSKQGETRTLNAISNFSESIEIGTDNNDVIVIPNLKIRNFETEIINGRKIHTKTFVEANIRVYDNKNMEIINNIDEIEGMQVLKTKEQVLCLVGTGVSKVQAKDTIMINGKEELAEIMRVDVKVARIETKSSYNKVLIKADSLISVVYLTTDNKVKCISTKIPIMGFVDMQNNNEDNIYAINYCIKNILVKPSMEEEHSIYVEADIEFMLEAYEVKEIDIIKDLYSTNGNLEFSKKQINAITTKQAITDSYEIKERIPLEKMNSDTVVSDINVMPSITKTEIINNKILYKGELKLEIIMQEGENISVETKTIPFNFEFKSDTIQENMKVQTDIQIISCYYTTTEDGSIDLNVKLIFNVFTEENKNLDIIDNIEVQESTEDNQYSMIIYFAKQGDTLWKIAKKFKSKVDDIASINNIPDENKINVGAQLYIPKRIKSSV